MKVISIKCPYCGKISYLSMTNVQYKKYTTNEDFIHNIFSSWSVVDRETLISGMCKDCQKEIFG